MTQSSTLTGGNRWRDVETRLGGHPLSILNLNHRVNSDLRGGDWALTLVALPRLRQDMGKLHLSSRNRLYRGLSWYSTSEVKSVIGDKSLVSGICGS